LSYFECPYNKLGTALLMEEYVHIAADLRGGNEFRFAKHDLKKLQLPKYALMLGHNNETQVCLLLRVEKSDFSRRVQVMIVNKIYTELEVNKEEREREEKKLGIKKRIRLEYERTNPAKDKEFNGAVEGRQN
jgi:hypothetical protein